jgi:hypothetical protein
MIDFAWAYDQVCKLLNRSAPSYPLTTTPSRGENLGNFQSTLHTLPRQQTADAILLRLPLQPRLITTTIFTRWTKCCEGGPW